jgi:queuine tRNA-ribosyltransferase
MGWEGPLLTDSGGFQVFSLGHGSVADEIKGKRCRDPSVQKISEEGVTFQSYRDGSLQVLTPERSIEAQCQMGADLIVAFDECTPYHSTRAYTEQALERSHRWEQRSVEALSAHNMGQQALYGVVQGGVYPDLRAESVCFVNKMPFFGHAIGGTLGSTREEMMAIVDQVTSSLDPGRPIHLLGIGGLHDILQGVALGVDTFDCVHPTRLARHGGALMPVTLCDPAERACIVLKRACYARDFGPLDPSCPCETCQNFSRAYLHHLIKAREILALTALTLHNVTFMNRFLQEIRTALEQDRFEEMRTHWHSSCVQ